MQMTPRGALLVPAECTDQSVDPTHTVVFSDGENQSLSTANVKVTFCGLI